MRGGRWGLVVTWGGGWGLVVTWGGGWGLVVRRAVRVGGGVG